MKNNKTSFHRTLRAASLYCLLAGGALVVNPLPAQAKEVTWYDGKKAALPHGSLLTNNPGYWGDTTPTETTYSYPEAPNNPADTAPRDATVFGNRLLDGQYGGDWHSPVGINGKPLIVDFDFHQTIRLNEVRVAQYQSQGIRLAEVEVKNETNSPWKKVYSRGTSEGALHHLVLDQPAKARFVRLTIQATGSITYISQVWMWGEAKAVAKTRQPNGLLPGMEDFEATKKAKPGDGTILSPEKLAAWRKSTGFKKQGMTWLAASTSLPLNKNYLEGNFLPGKAALQKPVQVTATQDESNSAALYLVNASDKPQKITVSLSSFKDSKGKAAANLTGELFAAGSIWTRRWGQALRPLISATNKPSGSLMEQYLTNGSVIKDFPVLHLPPRGTALLWITLHLNSVAPGTYTATLKSGIEAIPVRVRVQPLTLPTPNTWVRFWNNEPVSSSGLWFDEAAIKPEMEYQRSMGASVWQEWPENNNYVQTARQLLAVKDKRRAQYVIVLSTEIQSLGYTGKLDPDNLDAAQKKLIHDETLKHVEKARALGLTYNDWSIELWDEPTVNNMKSWAAVARLVKAADPKVQIYMNPLFWTREGTNPEGFVTDERQVRELNGWYNELVDISVPIQGQTNSAVYPEANRLFYSNLPRKVRAYFTHPNPGRNLSWEAFTRDYNGWGSYAYFGPRKDPWNDFDHPEFDYQIVYPGPNGYIPTIESESMRDSWQDYRLLTLLKQQGKAMALKQILDIYKSGIIDIPSQETPEDRDRRSIKAGEKLPYLRDMALRAALR